MSNKFRMMRGKTERLEKIESTGYFSRRPGFDSQHQQRSSQPPLFSVAGNLTSTSRLHRYQKYNWYTDIHIGKVQTEKLIKKILFSSRKFSKKKVGQESLHDCLGYKYKETIV